MSGGGFDEDELLVDPGRPPRWAMALLALAAIGLLALALVRVESHRRTTSSRSEPPVVVPTRPASPVPVLNIDTTADPVVAVVLDHGHLIAMRTASLVDLNAHGKVLAQRPLAGDAALGGEAPGVQLHIDRGHNLGWAVSILERRARVVTFDATTMQVRRVTNNNFIVFDAALLGGRLYVATSEGIAWVLPDGTSGHVPNVSGEVLSIAADPTRNRLLAVVSSGNPLIAVTPSGHIETVAGVAAIKAQVAVVGGNIWLGGFASRGAVLEKLDPTNLRPIQHMATVGLGPGAVLVGAGTNDLFVTSGGGAAVTWCVNASTGERADVFPVSPLAITSATGTTIALVDQQLRPLHPKRSCTG